MCGRHWSHVRHVTESPESARGGTAAMPGAHAKRVACQIVDDRYLRGLRMITGALAGLGLLAAGVVPFAVSGGARPVTREAEAVSSAKAVAAAPPDIARADEW